MSAEDIAATLSHCGQPMKPKGSRHGWQGDDELSTYRYACESCGATAALTTRIPVGPPSGVPA